MTVEWELFCKSFYKALKSVLAVRNSGGIYKDASIPLKIKYSSTIYYCSLSIYSTGSSDLLSPIFNRKEKQEEIHRTMSLSERLRQEFGLDDSTDDEDHKTGNLWQYAEEL